MTTKFYKSAFTLIELLLVLGVILVLLSLSLPAVVGVRQRAQVLKCQVNMKQLGDMLLLYAGDFKAYYPVWISDGPEVSLNPARWQSYTSQASWLFFHRRWIDYSGMSEFSWTFRCPANQQFLVDGVSGFDYNGVRSMYADPKFLDPSLQLSAWLGRLGAKAQRHDDVLFPSSKVGLFESNVWHGWKGAYSIGGIADGLEIYTSDRPATIWCFDGSVGGIRFDRALPGVDRNPIWWSNPIVLTANGVRGRDK